MLGARAAGAGDALQRLLRTASKSALAKAITASSSSGSCTTSLTSTANGLPKSAGAAGPAPAGSGASDGSAGSGASGGRPPAICTGAGAAAGGSGTRAAAAAVAALGASSSTPPAAAAAAARPARAGSRVGACAEAGGLAAARCVKSRFADHLLLDLVDLGLHAVGAGGVAVGSAGLGIVEPRRAAQRRQLLGRQAFAAHPAQHVEFALAHEVVAPLALDHRLELGLLELQLARIVLARLSSVQSVAGLATNRTTLRKKLSFSAMVSGHVQACGRLRARRRHARRPAQSPNIFCFSSRRCWASSDSVAVGRASRRARPMGSPVSSQ